MNKLICVTFALVFFGFLGASSIFACSCSLSLKAESLNSVVKKSYKNSSAVFVGEVVEIVQNPNVFFIEVKIKINQKWNSEIGDFATIKTGKGGGDCGYSFEIGKEYLIYAVGDKDELTTNICTRTALAEDNADIAVLNKIKKRKLKSSPK